jgi:2-polyprenyl-3-methyl-5-hydroxy-6-metoxy-1,4-benzoquinol methylase
MTNPVVPASRTATDTRSKTGPADGGLPSSRYAVLGPFDRYSRHRILIDEARNYRSVLECGCSTGFLSRLIAAEGGPAITGIELDADAATEARQYCRKVIVLDLNASSWTEQVGDTFDLVMFGDVLEHLAAPLRTLKLAVRLLRPGGRILISLPNVAHWTIRYKLLCGRFDYQDGGILDVTHMKFFTVKSAHELIREAGCVPIWFRPACGGRWTTRLRGLWNLAARLLPGVFAYQMIFLVRPDEGRGAV